MWFFLNVLWCLVCSRCLLFEGGGYLEESACSVVCEVWMMMGVCFFLVGFFGTDRFSQLFVK